MSAGSFRFFDGAANRIAAPHTTVPATMAMLVMDRALSIFLARWMPAETRAASHEPQNRQRALAGQLERRGAQPAPNSGIYKISDPTAGLMTIHASGEKKVIVCLGVTDMGQYG
jgi:hypothetical protein